MNNTSLIIISFLGSIIIAIPISFFYRKYLIKNRTERDNAKSELLNALQDAFIKNYILKPKDLIDLIEGFPKLNKLRLKLPWDLPIVSQQLKYRLATSIESDNESYSIK